MGSDYAPTLAKEIEAETEVETKFARLAHVVRGGIPTMRDRLLASLMGEAAVDALLAGKSNLVVCKIKGDIVLTDIRYALILDRMYKGKLKGGDLDDFTPEQIKSMEAACAEKKRELAGMYHAQWRLSL